jgi:glycine hydroxymethyltransferase
LITGGTDNHLMLIDLTNKKVTGQKAETALDKAGITVNKNAVPFDPRKPFDPSGIRLGTPAITTRGLKESECKYVAELIDKTINNHNNEEKLAEIRQEVKDLCSKFLLYEL